MRISLFLSISQCILRVWGFLAGKAIGHGASEAIAMVR